MEEIHQLKCLQKGTEGIKQESGIQCKALPDSVIGAFGYVKVCTKGRNRGKFSGNPGIEKGNQKTHAVGGMRDKDRKEQCMGFSAGTA